MRTLKRKKENGENKSRKRPGGDQNLKATKFICVQSKRQKTCTAPEFHEELNSTKNRPVSLNTFQRCLRSYSFKGSVAARKPLLLKQNRLKKLHWAKKYQNWSVGQWFKIIYSDESKF